MKNRKKNIFIQHRPSDFVEGELSNTAKTEKKEKNCENICLVLFIQVCRLGMFVLHISTVKRFIKFKDLLDVCVCG